MANILLIEDSLESQFLVKRVVEKSHVLHMAVNLYEAREKLKTNHYDVILLDITLPDGDGIQFCEELEKLGVTIKTPVIMLTAKVDVADKVQGLSSGADDYIAKPFDARELEARITSVLRRRGKPFAGDIELGSLTLSLDEQKAYKKNELGKNTAIDLTPIEFKILLAFAKKPADTITREDLFNQVWGKDIHLSVRNIDTHVCKLRQKILSTGILLRSNRGKGYLLVLPAPKAPEIKKEVNNIALPQGAS